MIAAAPTTTPFDPATWLAEAEGLGYQICLIEWRPGRFAISFENPERRLPASADQDLALWRNLRPSDEARDANERALRDYLLSIGRVLRPAPAR
jgi:hypothetical protein